MASSTRLLAGLLFAGALATLLLGLSPAPAGPRGSIDFDPTACGRWLAVGTAIRALLAVVLVVGAAVTFVSTRQRAPRRALAALVAMALASAGAGLHEFLDDAPPWPSFEALCRDRR